MAGKLLQRRNTAIDDQFRFDQIVAAVSATTIQKAEEGTRPNKRRMPDRPAQALKFELDRIENRDHSRIAAQPLTHLLDCRHRSFSLPRPLPHRQGLLQRRRLRAGP